MATKKSNILALAASIEKAQNEKMQVISHGAKTGGYVVIHEDKAYMVNVNDAGEIEGCTCPHSTERKAICKHMVKVALETGADIKGCSVG